MVEYYVIIGHAAKAILKMKQKFSQLHLNVDIMEIKEAPILDADGNKVNEVYILDCFSSFDDYATLRMAHKWTVTNHDNKISLIA